MVFPELRSILSPDLEPPALPADPLVCAVDFQVVIGPRGGDEAEAFAFTVVTPAYLAGLAEPRWGRGFLITARFDWRAVVLAVAQLLAESPRETWGDVVAELGRHLRREASRNGHVEGEAGAY